MTPRPIGRIEKHSEHPSPYPFYFIYFRGHGICQSNRWSTPLNSLHSLHTLFVYISVCTMERTGALPPLFLSLSLSLCKAMILLGQSVCLVTVKAQVSKPEGIPLIWMDGQEKGRKQHNPTRSPCMRLGQKTLTPMHTPQSCRPIRVSRVCKLSLFDMLWEWEGIRCGTSNPIGPPFQNCVVLKEYYCFKFNGRRCIFMVCKCFSGS